MAWIDNHKIADVLDSDFVDSYISATGAKYKPCVWGANKCPMLGRDLAEMAGCGALKRFRTGLAGGWQNGFPKWVWVYEASQAAYLYRTNS